MAINIDAIRKKMAQLKGQKSSVQKWKSKIGTHKLRGLPWKNKSGDQPFEEREVYYIGKAAVVAPFQFGLPDPIKELIAKLYASGTQEDKDLAKKLYPKLRVFMPVIDRADEDAGPQLWEFSKFVYNRLLGFYLDDDGGDILDPLEGFELKLTVTQTPGKSFMDTVVDLGKQKKLSDNSEQSKKWLDAVGSLDIDELYPRKSYEEISNMLKTWLEGGSSDDGSPGLEKANQSSNHNVLEDLEKEMKAESKEPEQKKSKSKVSDQKKGLDAAFADLMDE